MNRRYCRPNCEHGQFLASQVRAVYDGQESIHRAYLMTQAAFEAFVSQLSPGEKAQLLQLVARDLGDAFPGIDAQPDVCGGEPCIVRTRIPVWLLVQARRLGTSEAELLQSYPSLRAEDLTNAWAYARAHATEMERQIAENEAA